MVGDRARGGVSAGAGGAADRGGTTGVGDDLLAAGQAQRLWNDDPSSRIAVVGVDGRPRWASIWDGNPILARPDELAPGMRRVCNGPGARPYIVYPFSEDTGWTFNRAFKCREHRARLYLTPAEIARGDVASARYGPYVLMEPYTKHENFRWPLARWAALVEACPDLTFVQHTHADSTPVPGAHAEPATFREAAALARVAQVYVRSESGLCHAAAALGVPQVTIFGGCMDPDVMGGYPGQWVIADTGAGSPCGRWRPCAHCAAIMQGLSVETVAAALRAVLGGQWPS